MCWYASIGHAGLVTGGADSKWLVFCRPHCAGNHTAFQVPIGSKLMVVQALHVDLLQCPRTGQAQTCSHVLHQQFGMRLVAAGS
jgi:hypothetical protein